jgi:DNA-binding NtrC family response regulator
VPRVRPKASHDISPDPPRGGSGVLVPRALVRLHRHSLSHILVLGGDAGERAAVARSFHNESPMRSGPFVSLNCRLDEPTLRIALRCWLTATGRETCANPLWSAERGTLYLESVGRLSMGTQRQLLAFASQQTTLPSGCGSRWVGRLAVGNDEDPWDLVAQHRFLGALADVLDKIRVELNSRRKGGAA